MDWFTVDKQGLAKLLERRGKAWIVHELLQNSWDEEGATRVDVTIEPVPGRPLVTLRVEDDSPEGFRDLSHSFTLFAESYKKGNPEQRGRFNLGEKLVLALCERASIHTTTGLVDFGPHGRKESKRHCRETGTVFEATVRMTREELAEVEEQVRRVIVPGGKVTTFNGSKLRGQGRFKEAFSITLPTVTADEEGNLKRTNRKTMVEIYETDTGEDPMVFEMGIPVCPLEGGERRHVNVQQKVPLNMERDGLTPAYLRTLRVSVLNEMYDELEEEDATTSWVQDATSDKRCEDEAVTRAMTLRFGDKRVAYDPSDPEGSKLAMSKGYTVVHGGALSSGQWDNVRRSEAMLPAGKVTPSPKAYGNGPDLAPEVPREDWTEDMEKVVLYAELLGGELLGFTPHVRIMNTTNGFSGAWCDSGELHLNLKRLGHRWFRDAARGELEALDSLLIHEFAHDFESDHLASGYHKACCNLGAKLAKLNRERPGLFKMNLEFLRQERH